MSERVLKRIPLASIRENPVALRAVNRSDPNYLGMVASVRRDGVINPIVVRELPSADDNQLYGLIDGLHRYTASLDAGLGDIPAQVINMDDAATMEAQLIGNAHKIETKPVEYSKHLQRILSANPLLTMTQLASKLSKSGTWLSERLGLLKLVPAVSALVDEGKMNLSNAYALAKLPEDEQVNFVDRSISMAPQEFTSVVYARKKEIDTAKRQGRDAGPAQFVPVPHLQRLIDIKAELEKPTIGPVLVRESEFAKTTEEIAAANAGFNLGVRWVVHMDARSIEEAREKDAARKADLAQKKAIADADRAKNRAAEAAATAARLQAEGAGVPVGAH